MTPPATKRRQPLWTVLESIAMTLVVFPLRLIMLICTVVVVMTTAIIMVSLTASVLCWRDLVERCSAQVDPTLAFRDFQLLKLKYDKPLSNFAFNCKLCHYSVAQDHFTSDTSLGYTIVGRCRLPGSPQVDPRLTLLGFNT